MSIVQFQRGFSLVEVLLSLSIFILLVTALVGTWLYGQEATALAGNRARAVLLAEEGLEATRNIRDAAYANLTNGTYGLATIGNQWNLSGSSDANGIFTRQITIADANTNRKQITSQVTWQQNPQRTGSVQLITYLTNWQATSAPVNTCAAVCQLAGYTISGICRANANQCTANGETNVPSGALLCQAQNPATNVCCCK